MLMTPSAIAAFVRLKQLAKAPSPMLLTKPRIVTLVSLVQEGKRSTARCW